MTPNEAQLQSTAMANSAHDLKKIFMVDELLQCY